MKRYVFATLAIAILLSGSAQAQTCPNIDVEPQSLPDSTIGRFYNEPISASGGAAPYAWGVKSGALPPGLKISFDKIQGTPTTGGSYTFTLLAIDSNACTGSRTYTVNIIDPNSPTCQALSIGPTSLPLATVGELYSAKFTAGSGSGGYQYSFTGSLPPGLGFSAGTLNGFPTSVGTFELDVNAVDSRNCKGSRHYEVQVLPAGCAQDVTLMLSPANGSTADATKPVAFSWTAVQGADHYEVLASPDNGATFQTVATTPNASTTNANVTLAAGTWLAVVRTIFTSSCSTRSAISKFSLGVAAGGTCPATAPAAVAPASQSTTTNPSVTFTWTAVPNAATYEVFTSSNGAAFTDAGGTSSSSLTAIMPTGTIDWYVEARNGNCSPTKSTTSRFTVAPPQCGSGTINLLTPSSGATITSPVTFSWSPVAGASAYRVWVSVDGSANVNYGRVTTTTQTLPMPSGAVDWYVEALFDNCPSVISAHSMFTVSKSSNCGGAAAVPLSPINVDDASPVTFKWTAAQGASGYRVWLALFGDAFTDLGFTTNTQITRNVDPGSYNWYVESLYPGCPSTSSISVSFNVPNAVQNCTGQLPVVISPSNGAININSPVTFTWSGVPGASTYRVFASINNGPVQLVGQTSDTTLKKAIPSGTIVWFVEAAVVGCAATHSVPAKFTVANASCPTQKPQLLTPAAGSTTSTSPVTFSWSPVPLAVSYVLVAKPQHGAATVLGETSQTQLDRDVPAGTLEWWVVALGAGCEGTVSAHSTVTISTPSNCTTKRPHPLQPEDDSVNEASPVHFVWTVSPGASAYRLFAATDGDDPAYVATSTTNELTIPMPAGHLRWFVEAVFDACPALFSAVNDVTVAANASTCTTPDRPVSHVAAQVISGSDYNVRWTGVRGASVYELQEATTPDFIGAKTVTVSGVKWPTTHTTSAPQQYFYRVRAVSSCSDDKSSYSKIVTTRVVPPDAFASRNRATAEIGSTAPIVQTVTIPSSAAGQKFTASTDKPWITVSPSSGTVSPNGTTLSLTANPRALNVGTNQAGLDISYTGSSSSRLTTFGSNPPTSVPISISLVTPVTPDTKATPPPNSLIIPAVAHGPGANNSLFQSDIRVANVSSTAMKYLINFTPTATNGTQTGTTSTIQIDPGATTSLDDILASFFGTATDGASAGMLEIRPLSTSTSSSSLFSTVPSNALTTIASSRTYNVTTAGTFGQFIPAIPFTQFVGQGSVLSLQQIANSAAYRTNFGLLEASGEPATVVIHVFDKSGAKLADIPESLLPSEHLALNGLLAANNVPLDDGRVEVEVTSSTGKVSAYASVLDNRTNDPLLVSPVIKGTVSSNRYVIPGVAYTNSIANWRTDARLYNSGNASVTATMTYYPQAGSADMTPVVRTTTIAAGETKVLDNILNATFGVNSTNAGGSVVVTTPATSSIIATARTYAAVANGGTIGQFVPAVTPADSIGAGDRSLQLLQLEQSESFRTNIGIAETTGNAATAEVSMVLPDSKITPVISIALTANEFIQLPLSAFGLNDAIYNARVAVRVVDGTGKVTAYGSLVDNVSQDPTYVPAQ